MSGTSGGASPATRRAGAAGRTARAVVVVIALVLGLLAATLGRRLASDWLSRRVTREAEAALRQALGTGVRVGAARLASDRELVLSRIDIDAFSPGVLVNDVHVRELRFVVPEGESITGGWTRLERLEIDAPVAMARIPDPGAPEGARRPASPLPRIGTVVVRDGRLSLAKGRFLTLLAISGELHDVGGAASGAIDVESAMLPLGMIEQLASGSGDPSLLTRLRIPPGTSARAAGHGELLTDGRVTLNARLSLEARALADAVPESLLRDIEVVLDAEASAPDEAGRRTFVAALDVPGAATASVRGAHSEDAGLSWSQVDARVPALSRAWLGARDDAGERAASLAGLDWTSARADVHATPRDGGAVDWRATAWLEGARAGTLGLGSVRLELAGARDATGAVEGNATILLDDQRALSGHGRLVPHDETHRVVATVRAEPGVIARFAPPGTSVTVVRDSGGTARASGLVSRGPSGLRLGADLGAIELAVRTTAADDATARVVLSSVRVALDASRASAVAEGEVDLPALGPAQLHVDAHAPRDRLGAWSLDGTLVLREGLGSARLTARASDDGGGAMDCRLEGAGLLPWLSAAAPALVREARLGAAGLTGDAIATLDASWDARGAWTARATGTVANVAAQSADYSRALSIEGIAWSAEAAGEGGSARASIEAEAAGAQVLRGPLFADLSKDAPHLVATLARDAASGGWSADGTLAAGALGRLALGVASPGAGIEATGVRVTIASDSLGGTWAALGRAGVLKGMPELARLAPSGTLRLVLEGTLREGAAELAGELGMSGVAIADPENRLALEDASGTIPLRLLRASEGAPWQLAAASGGGVLRARRAAAFGAELRDAEVPLLIEDGSVRATEALSLSLLDGSLVLSDLTLRDPLGHEPALEAAVEARDLRLAALGPVGPFVLDGSVGARFPRVSLSADRLVVDGGARILAWGGAIDVREVAVAGPLSRFPRTRVSATFSEIDLMELTSTFGFGAVTGLAEGSIEDFELFGLTPVRFAARLATSEREGIPQTLSVPALQNLATLATGGRAPLFDKGLLKLVKTLRYEKLGASATLQADAFMLRGLAERDGRELFLKGRLPLRVDVANAEPGAAVSFRAMMRRLAGLEGVGDAPPP